MRRVWWQTGGDALAALKRQRPDLLICDIRLPDMTGEEIFRQALSELGTSPVLFITAYGDIEQAVRLVRGGADDYLTKPFDIDDLLERIERLLGDAAGHEERLLGLGAVGADAPDRGPASTRGRCRQQRAVHGRERRRQGGRRSLSPPGLGACQLSVHGGQLRRDSRRAHGERAVRPRARRFHRRAQPA